MPPEAAPSPDDGGDLCLECGMCCNGTLFNFAKLSEEEIATGVPPLPVIEMDGRKGFALPCGEFDPATCGCGIYLIRPAVCRKYRCKTLRALDAGEVDYPEAARRVAETRQLADVLRPQIAAESIPTARFQMGAAGGLPQTSHDARLRLQMVALNRLLERWFFKDREPGS